MQALILVEERLTPNAIFWETAKEVMGNGKNKKNNFNIAQYFSILSLGYRGAKCDLATLRLFGRNTIGRPKKNGTSKDYAA